MELKRQSRSLLRLFCKSLNRTNNGIETATFNQPIHTMPTLLIAPIMELKLHQKHLYLMRHGLS